MTLTPPRLLLLAATLGVLAACQPKSSTPADSSPPVATVNGVPIARDLYDYYVKGATGKPAAELPPDVRDKLLDNLVRAELVSQEAVRQGIDKTGDTAYILELSRLNVLEQALSDHYLKDRKPTESELRAEYESDMAQAPKMEYHARHILVATEPFAEKLIQRLDRGEKFEDLAKVESMDPSKSNGGDIGWLRAGMPPQLMNALAGLKPGDYTKTPVQTSYGWHILQLVESRPLSPPPFDQAKQRVEQIVEAKKFRAYMDELMRTAKVTKTLESPAASLPAPALAPAAPATPASPAPAGAPATKP
ncbi:MAG: peptidyl-prolyl cis-trans isomerase [Steroidobacteraceae bacterium]